MPLQVFCRNCAQYRHEWCNLKVDSPDPDLARDCQYYSGTTNADRIRAMTDEELSEFLAEERTAPSCTAKCHKDYEIYGELRTFCSDCWLDWLKQEAE